MASTGFSTPAFEEVLVEDNLKDGYWIAPVDINGDGKPDLIASGLAVGEIVWYENPSWKKHRITTLPKPVALDSADIARDGRADLVVCHDYGTCMYDCKPEDGKVSWLRNPGRFDGAENWEVHFIGSLVASHRLRFGHFTQTRNLELMTLPVVGPHGGREALHSPIRYVVFEANRRAARGWLAWHGCRRLVLPYHPRRARGQVWR